MRCCPSLQAVSAWGSPGCSDSRQAESRHILSHPTPSAGQACSLLCQHPEHLSSRSWDPPEWEGFTRYKRWSKCVLTRSLLHRSPTAIKVPGFCASPTAPPGPGLLAGWVGGKPRQHSLARGRCGGGLPARLTRQLLGEPLRTQRTCSGQCRPGRSRSRTGCKRQVVPNDGSVVAISWWLWEEARPVFTLPSGLEAGVSYIWVILEALQDPLCLGEVNRLHMDVTEKGQHLIHLWSSRPWRCPHFRRPSKHRQFFYAGPVGALISLAGQRRWGRTPRAGGKGCLKR